MLRWIWLLLLSSGCYLSHTITDDAGVHEGDAGPDANVEDAPVSTCPSDVATLELGAEPGCVSMVVPTRPVSLECAGAGSTIAGATVLVRRAGTGSWSFLVRSRGREAGTLCAAVVPPDDCSSCRGETCVTGTDLVAHGAGGSLPDGREVRLLIDNAGDDAWLRVCSPPP
jgi:hypothetical protein